MNEIRFCPFCGRKTRDNAKFCNNCGRALPEKASHFLNSNQENKSNNYSYNKPTTVSMPTSIKVNIENKSNVHKSIPVLIYILGTISILFFLSIICRIDFSNHLINEFKHLLNIEDLEIFFVNDIKYLDALLGNAVITRDKFIFGSIFVVVISSIVSLLVRNCKKNNRKHTFFTIVFSIIYQTVIIISFIVIVGVGIYGFTGAFYDHQGYDILTRLIYFFVHL